uniref:Uncharacterized protein n=1 Tax=Nitratidesulfovibrio vulgaris (strain DSM 19637 / Miyazaki F) TaxID=883 RepID=B8DLY1_NITV9
MIDVYETSQFGINGRGISYYTGSDAGKNVFIDIPQDFKSGGIPPKFIGLTSQFPVPSDSFAFINALYYINYTLNDIYFTFGEYRKGLPNPEIVGRHYMGIQNVVFFLNKTINMCIYRQCVINNNAKKEPLVIFNTQTLFEGKESGNELASLIYSSVFKSQNSQDLARILEWLKQIYFSINMYTNTRTWAEDYPTVTAIEPSHEIGTSYFFHNHSLWQIILGMNAFIQEIELFAASNMEA